jgi:xylose dehydrogenase (NAD/NADP)
MSVVKLGLLGASRIASKVLPLICDLPQLEIKGVAARDPEKAKAFAESHKLSTAYSSYDECLSSDGIDAVYISVLNSDHAALIKKSLLTGKHVLCEKPLVLTSIDAAQLYALANERGLILLEGLMYRFSPQITKMMALIADGTIGEIKSIHVDFSFLLHDLDNRRARATASGGGGALNDLGCYAVDFISLVARTAGAGEVVHTSTFQRRDAEIDLSTTANLRFKGGLEATFSTAIDHASVNTWEVRGTKGSIAALRFDSHGHGGMPLYVVNEDSEANIITCSAGTQFRDEFENFAQSVLKTSQPFISPDESIENARLMDAIRAAVVDSR